MKFERLPDWPQRLGDYIEGSRGKVVSGEMKLCGLFGAGAVEAQTGIDPAAPFKGKYSKVAKELERTVDRIFPEIQLSIAQTGDLVFDGEAVGVLFGPVALFIGVNTVGKTELVRVARKECVKAWGVGHE